MNSCVQGFSPNGLFSEWILMQWNFARMYPCAMDLIFGSINNCVGPILRSMSCWVSVRRHSGRRVSYPNGIYPNRPLSEWARVLRVTLLRILELLKSRPFIGIFNVYSFKSIVVIFCFTGSWYGDICLANL